MLNTAPLNTRQLNDGPDLSPILGGEFPRAVTKYSLEVRSKTGSLKAYLSGWWGGTYVARLNQAHDISFSYTATEHDGTPKTEASYLTTANQIWLRDDTGALVQKFHIKRATPQRDGARVWVEVFGLSIFCQLHNEYVSNYSATDTVYNHLKAWLDAQEGSLPIRIGYIAPAYRSQSFKFEYDARRIKDAFGDMYNAVGEGDFYVDPYSRRLNWKTRSGDKKGQRIRYGLNVRGIRKQEDDSEHFTRLYLYGDGNGVGDALNLVDAGEANEYIQQDTGTYGVIVEKRVMKEIKDADTLLAVANALLDAHSTPYITYEVDCADYSNSNDGPDYSFERLRLGSTVKVIDDSLDIEVTCKVVELKYNLDNPVDIQVTLDNKPKDLRFIIRDLLERVETLETEPMPMGDQTPQPVGTAAVGTSMRASRQDHSHAIDADDLADMIENDATVNDAIETVAAGAGAQPGSPILSVSTANADGSSDDFARVDHVHKGNHFSASDAASLPAEADGSDGVTTGANKRLYGRVDSTWVCLSHLE